MFGWQIWWSRILPLGLTVLVAGCIDPFGGSQIMFQLGKNINTPCEVIKRHKLTTKTKCTGDPQKDRVLFHYELWATVRSSAAVYATSITVQPAIMRDAVSPEDPTKAEIFKLEKDRVLLSSGREFKIGWERYFDELSKDEQAEVIKKINLTGKKLAITTFSNKLYSDTAKKQLADGLYVGNQSQLSLPYNGELYGLVETTHPFGAGVVSGGELKVEPNLTDLNSLWVTIEELAPDRDDPKPSSLIYLKGVAQEHHRGAVLVEAVSPLDSSTRATFSVYSSLAEEGYF